MKKKSLQLIFFALSKAYFSVIGMLALSGLQTSDTANCKETVCFNATMINFLWVMVAATTLASSYEMYSRKPLFASPKKTALLSGTNFMVSAVPWGCYSMVNDCPHFLPKCMETRQLICGLNVLAASAVVVNHILNKQT